MNRMTKIKTQTLETGVKIAVTLMLCASYMMGTSATVTMALGIIFMLVLLFSKPEEALYHIAFILCANELVHFGSTSITMIFVAVFTVKHIVFCGILKFDVKFLLISTFLFAFCFLNFFDGTSEPLVNSIKQLFFLYFITVVLRDTRAYWNELFGNVFRAVALGIIYFGIVSFVTNGIPTLNVRYTIHEEVTINFLAIVCAITIVNLIYDQTMLNRGRKNNFLIAGCAIFGILTQSRSFILAVLIGVTWIFLFMPNMNRKLKMCFAVVVVILLFAFLIEYVPIVSQYFEAITGRILNPSGDDISNGRYVMWEATVHKMTENPYYFWLGAGDYNKIGASFDDKVMVAHNMFLETWVIFGIVGSVILLFIFLGYIYQEMFYKRCVRFSLISLAPLAVMMCALFYSHHFIGRSMSLIFIINWLPVALVTKEQKMEVL